jgi:hypothetical protein
MTGHVMATWFGPCTSADQRAANNWIRQKVQAILEDGTASLLGATHPGLPASRR